MTFKFMRPALAIALALTLGACGGKASFTVAGTIAGLQYNGLVLSTNGMDLPVNATATSATNTISFTFPNSISYGEVYNVTVKSPPAHQSCQVGSFPNGTGPVLGAATDTAGRLATINVGVLCSVNPYSIGGTVTGLTATMTGLQLTNGSDPAIVTVTPAEGTDVKFTFPTQVRYGTTYGVTVLTQPTGATCTVSNGSAVMGDAMVENIAVSCVKN
jgi:hypothetical protein